MFIVWSSNVYNGWSIKKIPKKVTMLCLSVSLKNVWGEKIKNNVQERLFNWMTIIGQVEGDIIRYIS